MIEILITELLYLCGGALRDQCQRSPLTLRGIAVGIQRFVLSEFTQSACT